MTLSLLFVFFPFSCKHLHGLGVWLGRGSLGARESTVLLGWGLLLPFSPPLPASAQHEDLPLPITTQPHLSLRISHLLPQKCLCLSLFVLFVVGSFWFWFRLSFLFLVSWFCFFFFVLLFYFENFFSYNFEVFVFKEKLLYFVKKVGGKTKRPPCLYKETK